MCRHCAPMVEDKNIVHAFMDLAARRLSEKHGHPISADELEANIEIVSGAVFDARPIRYPTPAQESLSRAAIRILGKDGAFG